MGAKTPTRRFRIAGSQHSFRLAVGFLFVVLAACEAAATPIAAVPTASEAAAEATASPTPPPYRYGILSDTLPYVRDVEALQDQAQLESVPANADLQNYDLLTGYGTADGWETAPTTHHVALLIHPALPPLDDATLRAIVQQSSSPRPLITRIEIPGLRPASDQETDSAALRTQLANQGYPDGLRLVLAAEPVPGIEAVRQQLAASNLRTRLSEAAPADILTRYEQQQAHLFLVRWIEEGERRAWTERIGTENVIELYSIPIRYRVRAGLSVAFSAEGFPILPP